jgi:hypothetical protein
MTWRKLARAVALAATLVGGGGVIKAAPFAGQR